MDKNDGLQEKLLKIIEAQENLQSIFVEYVKATETRRVCEWSYSLIVKSATQLEKLVPDRFCFMRDILQELEMYAKIKFETSQDLNTLAEYLSLINVKLWEMASLDLDEFSVSRLKNDILMFLRDLKILDHGEPPNLTVAEKAGRSVYPQLATETRFEQRQVP